MQRTGNWASVLGVRGCVTGLVSWFRENVYECAVTLRLNWPHKLQIRIPPGKNLYIKAHRPGSRLKSPVEARNSWAETWPPTGWRARIHILEPKTSTPGRHTPGRLRKKRPSSEKFNSSQITASHRAVVVGFCPALRQPNSG